MSADVAKKMKTLIQVGLLLVCHAPFTRAGGGGEDIVAELNGWTVRIGSGGGSEAYIEKKSDGVRFHGRIRFEKFWDYYLVLKSFPRSPKN